MDVIKIGQFLKSLRKEKSLTQREVAEQLNVSEKTISKWETGNGLPEVSLMLPLCQFYGISLNELLSGERLSKEQYVERAEENIASLVTDRTSPRKKVIVSTVSCVASILCCVALIILAALFAAETWLRIVLIGIAVVLAVSNVALIVLIAVNTEIYECGKCGGKFVPTLSAYVMAPHTLTRRRLKCPYCGKRCWNRSRLRK